MEFIYETHLHTIEGSACSRTPAVDHIAYMKALGYYSGAIEADSGKKPSFGPGMTQAIKKYQTYVVKFTNIKNIDGVITGGKTTWKKLLGL